MSLHASAGPSLARAKAACLLVHGRGASAKGMLDFAEGLAQPDVAFVAPQAPGYTWYPYSFLAPLRYNEPGIPDGVAMLHSAVADLEAGGIPADQIVVLGFSQGACLAAEMVARHPTRYAGLVVLSGGLIGNGERAGVEPPADKTFDYAGSLDRTPVFLGCSDIDPHIPLARVERTAEVFAGLDAEVEKRIYPNFGHGINDDEVAYVRGLL
ncbi:MAG: alpha/beta fold hydrolase, partial [Bacteroidota bacterium]